MKNLKNWDKNNWLSSKKYITNFHNYLRSEIKFNQNLKILDIGCGRANIISFLQAKYRFIAKPIGLDIIKHNETKKNITFFKKDAIKFLKDSNLNFDLVLIKQTIHFFKIKEIKELLRLSKSVLSKNGKIILLTLETKNNQIPCFKKMKIKLKKSLDRDKKIENLIKKSFIKYKLKKFQFMVSIRKNIYIRMIKQRYISCLLGMSKKEIQEGILEINSKYRNKIFFKDILSGYIYKN